LTVTERVVAEKLSKRFLMQRRRRTEFKEHVLDLVRGGSVELEEYWALRQVDLRVREGESLGVIGGNGAGKTTLLRCLAGILEPTSGKLTTRGRVTALLELGAGFHPNLTGRENVYLHASLHGVGRREARRSMDEIIDFSGLRDFIDVPLKSYSSGMYLRLAFSVAVHVDPDILLIDEIIAVGDEAFQERCLDRMSRFRSAGKAILLVTHDLDTLRSFCDRVLLLEDGAVAAEGFPGEVIDLYRARMQAPSADTIGGAREDDAPQTGGDGMAPAIRTEQGDGEPEPGARIGPRPVEITAVRFVDSEGRVGDVLETGRAAEIRISYRVHETVDRPVFGLAIYDSAGRRLNGPNTRLAGAQIHLDDREGEVAYVIDALPLRPGDYSLTTAVYEWDCATPIDHLERMHRFRVVGADEVDHYGLLFIPARWIHRATVRSR